MVIRYAEFVRYEAMRNDANTAVMGVLAGSRLAAHTLQLTSGSQLQLSEIFPNVDHIRRFNLRSDVAADVLSNAEHHIAVMTLPYVLAIHEAHVTDCADFMVADGVLSRTQRGKMNPKNMHETIQRATGERFPHESLALFQFFRSLRNALVHSGAKVTQELVDSQAVLSDPATDSLWQKLTRRNQSTLSLGDALTVGQPEMSATLAVTKFLAEYLNEIMSRCCSRDRWADMLVADVISEGRSGNHEQLRRRISGIARNRFQSLAFSDLEIEAAMARASI